MTTYFSFRFFFPAIVSATLLAASVLQVSAETFRGRVDLRGSITYRGVANDIVVRISGTGLKASNDLETNYNASGLFESAGSDYLGSYSGTLRTVANNQGKVVRKKQRRPIRVSRRKIRFTDGTIRLKRPLRDRGLGKYRLRGRGIFRVSA